MNEQRKQELLDITHVHFRKNVVSNVEDHKRIRAYNEELHKVGFLVE